MTTNLLAVFAHPDDEFGVSGVMAQYAANGSQVVLACVTRGEVGEISDPSLATPETLGTVREAELRAACDALGIPELRFLGYRDSGMQGTPENDDPRCYHQADPEAATEQLVGLIREVKPQIVLTFEPYGGYGHPDHIATNRYTTAAFDAAGKPDAYPNAGPPWQPQGLFYVALPHALLVEFRAQLEALGMDAAPMDHFIDNYPIIDDQITHKVDVSAQFETRWAAFQCHRTQIAPDHFFHQMPTELLHQAFGHEYYIQARPPLTPTPDEPLLDDLIAGLDG